MDLQASDNATTGRGWSTGTSAWSTGSRTGSLDSHASVHWRLASSHVAGCREPPSHLLWWAIASSAYSASTCSSTSRACGTSNSSTDALSACSYAATSSTT